jgi:hypothetical protein
VIKLQSFEPVLRAQQLKAQLTFLAFQWHFLLFPVTHDINKSERRVTKERWSQDTIASIRQQFREEISYFDFQPPGDSSDEKRNKK